MAQAKKLRIYLNTGLKQDAEAGRHNFINRIGNAFASAGYETLFCKNTPYERLNSVGRKGFTLFHMEDPFHSRALTFRRAYYYPFWHIEASAKRWEWDVAKSDFDPDKIDAEEAKRFSNFWRKRLFQGFEDDPRAGYVFLPLQGRLKKKRSFQTCSPLEMIKQTLEFETQRKIILSHHPKEIYSEAEQKALADLVDANSQLVLFAGNTEAVLPSCDYIVTQNSAVAFAGYFFEKPAVLFGRSDFHHIALNVGDIGSEKAFHKVTRIAPDFDRYIYWFLQLRAINAGRPDAEEKILQAVRRGGWQI